VFLGVADGRAHFALDISAVASPLTDFGWEGAATFPDLRATVGLLPPGDGGIAAQARHIVDWHSRHGFCPGCGEKTRPRTAAGRASAPRAAASTSRARIPW